MPGPADPLSAAFAAAPRDAFLRASQRRHAGLNEPLPIGHGQTSSQPSTVRSMLELLEVQPGERVLDVGSGSGWTTALLAHLVGPGGTVIGVERFADFVESSRKALERLRISWAAVEQAGSVLGAPATAPYDRILVSAQARVLPQQLVAQLAEGGVMVLPVAGRIIRVVREGGQARTTRYWPCRFVPLVEDDSDDE